MDVGSVLKLCVFGKLEGPLPESPAGKPRQRRSQLAARGVGQVLRPHKPLTGRIDTNPKDQICASTITGAPGG
jgi:hypothetical protein